MSSLVRVRGAPRSGHLHLHPVAQACPVLSCPVLSCPVISCHLMSCPRQVSSPAHALFKANPNPNPNPNPTPNPNQVSSPAHALFEVPPEPLDASAYFWFVCMMNHSCAPNGGVAYDPPAGTPPHPRHAPGEGGGECYVSPPVAQHDQSTLTHWCGCYASSGRAWRLWAARHSQGKRPRHWAPSHWARSHCLGCSSEPPSESPTPPPRRPLPTEGCTRDDMDAVGVKP